MNNTRPLVSILIPVYNRESVISETIDCAINQTYENIEIIVSDNCSQDKTWSILEEYAKKDKRIKIFSNEVNVGPVLNWIKCTEVANGEYVKFLFSDDLLSPNYIQNTLNLFDERTAFVITPYDVFMEYSGNKSGSNYSKSCYTSESFIENLLIHKDLLFSVSPCVALFRKKDVCGVILSDIVNPFGLDFKKFGAGNDILIMLEIATIYCEVKVDYAAKVYYRYHSSSLTISNNLKLYYDYAQYFFIKRCKPHLLDRFIALLFVESLRFKQDNSLVKLLRSNLLLSVVVQVLMTKILRRLLLKLRIIS